MTFLKCFSLAIFIASSLSIQATSLEDISLKNLQQTKTLQNDKYRFELVPQKLKLKDANGTEVQKVLLGYPKNLLNQGMILGAVIAKIDDGKNTGLTGLKINHALAVVKTQLINKEGKNFLALMQAAKNEVDAPVAKIEIPVQSVDESRGLIYIDLTNFGDQLRVAEGKEQNLTHTGAKAISAELDKNMLIFDIENYYVRAGSSKTITFTTRWFLRLTSESSPFFTPRLPTPGVGYFTWDSQYIHHYSIYDLANNPVKIYFKNVPKEYRSSFAEAAKEWNRITKPIFGHKFLDYEFTEINDPKIVNGDPRYSVVEWDIDNMATWNGGGIHTYNPLSGEIISSQVVLQGPEIVRRTKKWFDGEKSSPAEKMRFLAAKNQPKPTLKMGGFKFTGLSEEAGNLDVFHDHEVDYFPAPKDVSFEVYVKEVLRQVAAHEIGHAIGIRHNYKGSLNGNNEASTTVSNSIMEYLDRPEKYLSRVGSYDLMALEYGYLGKLPSKTNLYCTDEEDSSYDSKNSPECARYDSGLDPFSYLEKMLYHSTDLLINKENASLPSTWSAKDVWGPTNLYFTHFLTYATNTSTANSWEHFFGKFDRPNNPDEVSAYVIEKVENWLCGDYLDKAVTLKPSAEAQNELRNQIALFRAQGFQIIEQMKSFNSVLSPEKFSCYK